MIKKLIILYFNYDSVVKSPDRCHCEERSDVEIFFFKYLQRQRLLHFVRNDNFFDFLRLHQISNVQNLKRTINDAYLGLFVLRM